MSEPNSDARQPDALQSRTENCRGPAGFVAPAGAARGASAFDSTGSGAIQPPLHPTSAVSTPGVGSTIKLEAEPDLPQIPGYSVRRMIGGGGMGTVFEAVHVATERVVALKLINAGWANDGEFRTRFQREVKTLAALDHPNIVPIYTAESWQGFPYLTMKFIAGRTLSHHLERIRRDLRGACRLLADVARAIHYLHSRGIVHRDLKPLNILVTPEGKPLVADFGLARPVDDDSNLSLTLVPLGTRQYMSPEQTRGGKENYTFSCDIWALGIILYEILTGDRPFANEDTVELFQQIRYHPTPPIPAELNAPPALEFIARKCLEKNKADRYQTAEEVAVDLENWLAGKEIVHLPAGPETPLPPAAPVPEVVPDLPAATRKLPHNRRPVRALAVVGLLAVLGFSGVSPVPPTPEEPPPPPKTVAQLLKDGQTVWLLGEKGMPHVLDMPDGLVGHISTDPSGYCSIGAAESALIELATGEHLPPFAIEAEVALLSGTETSFFGVYVGRRGWAGDGTTYQSCYALTINAHQNFPWPFPQPPGRLDAIFVYFTRTRPVLHFRSITPPFLYHPLTLRLQDPPVWQTLRFAVTAQDFHARSLVLSPGFWTQLRVALTAPPFRGFNEEMTLKPVSLAIAPKKAKGLMPKISTPPSLEPNSGGIGLFLSEGQALFRNVRLVPLGS